MRRALFGAVTVAAWVGGYRAAVLVAMGQVACNCLFMEPRGQAGPFDVPSMIGLVAYLFTYALIIGIGAAMPSAQLRARERGQLMLVTLASIGDAVITSVAWCARG